MHFNVTAHPTAEWTAQQLREAFPFEQVPKYLLRDRDRIFGTGSRRWVGSIIGTNVAPPELRTAVQLSHSNNLLYCRLIGGGFSDRGPRRSTKT